MAHRFTPDYHKAFDAWLALDPFDDPAAPPGPAAMPEYHNTHRAEAEKLNAEASEKFDQGTEPRDTSGKFVRRPCCSHRCSSWWPSASDSRRTRRGWR